MSTDVTSKDLITLIESEKKNKGWTETEFAKQVGISRAKWYLVLRGERELDAPLLGKIMNVFPNLTVPVINYLHKLGVSINAKND